MDTYSNSRSFFSFVVMLICAALLLAAAPAHATASFGRTSIGSIPSDGLRSDFKRGSRHVLAQKGTLQQICAYVDGNGGGAGVQNIRYALYRDRNGSPAELVAESFGFPLHITSIANWYCDGVSPVPLDAGAYWVVIHSGGDPGIVRYYYDGPANWRGNVDQYLDGSADTFGTAATGQGTPSIRIDYYIAGEIRSAGSTTVGSRVSSPMSGQMKRGSSFVLTEGAAITSLNAYVDSLGGASGSQPITLALYDDKNGEPSALIAQGSVSFRSPAAGHMGRWLSTVPEQEGPVLLTPGRYWIVIHSGSPAGVYRYYLSDGAGSQGNWRGNANPGASASLSFGAATRGDGTISAHILYTPAAVVRGTFGRTTPGNIPSSGLRANYMRGSNVSINTRFVETWITGLWAYLDGNGGAAGSQKLQLVVYGGYTPDSLGRYFLRAVSEEVTIPAGMSPRWVRFAVPYTRVFNSEGHAVMIRSGGTAGVVRNYATNDIANWIGIASNYEGLGPPATLYTDDWGFGVPVLQQGDVSISVYGEFVHAPLND